MSDYPVISPTLKQMVYCQSCKKFFLSKRCDCQEELIEVYDNDHPREDLVPKFVDFVLSCARERKELYPKVL